MPRFTTPEQVLEYWFADTINGTVDTFNNRMRLWFMRSSPEFEAIQFENEGLIQDLIHGRMDWDIDNHPKAAMAKVIVLDQFSRAVYRGTANAFAADEIAANLVRAIAEKGWFLQFSPIERLFLCVSLQHSENMVNQDLGVQLASRVGEGAGEEIVHYFSNIKGFPDEHYDVVKRFGRFPHRNEVLGRESTAEELAWLHSDDCPAWAKSQRKDPPK